MICPNCFKEMTTKDFDETINSYTRGKGFLWSKTYRINDIERGKIYSCNKCNHKQKDTEIIRIENFIYDYDKTTITCLIIMNLIISTICFIANLESCDNPYKIDFILNKQTVVIFIINLFLCCMSIILVKQTGWPKNNNQKKKRSLLTYFIKKR